MKKICLLTLLVLSVLFSAQGIMAQNSPASGTWSNTKAFHIDWGVLVSSGYINMPQLYQTSPLAAILLTTRLSYYMDFGFTFNDFMIGLEPAVHLFYTEPSYSSTSSNYYFLEVSGRAYLRYSFQSFHVQIFGGYYCDILSTIQGYNTFNGAEAGVRFGFGNFVMDVYYVFIETYQIKVSLGYGGRIL